MSISPSSHRGANERAAAAPPRVCERVHEGMPDTFRACDGAPAPPLKVQLSDDDSVPETIPLTPRFIEGFAYQKKWHKPF